MAKEISLTPRPLHFLGIPLRTNGQETAWNSELLWAHIQTNNFVPQADIEAPPAVVVVLQLTAWSLQRLVPYYGKKKT
jgi:hypothetical protein